MATPFCVFRNENLIKPKIGSAGYARRTNFGFYLHMLFNLYSLKPLLGLFFNSQKCEHFRELVLQSDSKPKRETKWSVVSLLGFER